MAVVTVALSELDAWLKAQPENTVDTPYELNITGLTVSNIAHSTSSGTLGYIITRNSTKYVDLSETLIPASVTNMSYCFAYCTSLTKAPVIPSSVTNMGSCFAYCTSLTEAPVIPNSVKIMTNCFKECTSLTKAPVIPSFVTEMGSCFHECTSLTEAPVIPNSVKNMSSCFNNCTSLTKAPVIPNSVTKMGGCFNNCTSLTEAPVIPNSVTDMNTCFYKCTSLTKAPVIPSSVTNMGHCFDKCTSLTEVSFENPINVTNFTFIFNGCNALDTFKTDVIYTTKQWLTTIRNKSTSNLPKEPNQYNYEHLNTPAVIPFSLLNDELGGLPANTTSTPYQIKVTELTAGNLGSSENAGTLGYILNSNNSKYVNLSSTELPSDITSLYRTFKSCSSMIKCPQLPNVGENTIITTAQECFSGCVNLTGDFPSYWNIDNMASCFHNCASLTDTGITKIESNNFSNCFYDDTSLSKPPAELICKTTGSFEKCFHNCQNMRGMPAFTMFKSGCDYNNCFSYCNYAFSGRTEGNYFPIVINGTGMNLSYLFKGMDLNHSPKITINPDLELETVSNSDYNNLSYMFANCTSFGGLKLDVNYCNIDNICSNINSFLSFELNVKTRNCKSATNAFLNRKLSSVTADIETDDATAMFKNCTFNQNKINGSIKSDVVASIFENCSTLRDYPTIINPVNMSSAFKGCSTLTVTSLSIPNAVTNIQEAFAGCSSITSVDKILIQITNAKEAFKDCTSLTTIEDFRIPIERLDSANFQDMFSGCTALSTIKVPYKAPVETQDWHLYLLDIGSSSVAGKVYDKEGTVVTVQSTSIGKDKLKLPIYTDELMFTNQMSMADLETLARKILQYKYGVYNRTTLEPDKKNFVLYADNEENVITNLPFVKKSEVVNTVESGNLHSVSSNAVAESLKGKLNNTLSNITASEVDNLSGSEISVQRISNYNIGWVSNDGFIIHIPWSNEFARQIAIDDENNWLATRFKASGKWFPWKVLSGSEGDDSSPVDITSSVSRNLGVDSVSVCRRNSLVYMSLIGTYSGSPTHATQLFISDLPSKYFPKFNQSCAVVSYKGEGMIVYPSRISIENDTLYLQETSMPNGTQIRMGFMYIGA